MWNARAQASGAAAFGGVMGVIALVLIAFGQSTVLFLALAAILLTYAVVLWRRTRLPLMTIGAAVDVLLALAMAGVAAYQAPIWIILALAAAMLAESLCLKEIEKRWHPGAMKKLATVNPSFADILLLWHIPWLVNATSENRGEAARNREQPQGPPSADQPSG
jgi:hypothetical protein